MAERAEPAPGRPRKELRGEILDLLAPPAEHRALTLGSITDRVDGSRRTVKDRLDTLVEEDAVSHEKIGNATAYWIEEDVREEERTPAAVGLVATVLSPVVVAVGLLAGTWALLGRILTEQNLRAVDGRESKLLLANVLLISSFSTVGFSALMWWIQFGGVGVAAFGVAWLGLAWVGLALEYRYFDGEVPGVPFRLVERTASPA